MLALAGSVSAATINFDDQGLIGPGVFIDASPIPQTLSIAAGGVTAVFTGGVILTDAFLMPANLTSIYGTADSASVGADGMSNPLTITFSAPITNFLVDVLNGLPANIQYRVSDNAGNASVFTLAPNTSSGATTIGFAAAGTQVQIASITAPTTTWDFFIDNIRFNTGIQCGTTGCNEVAAIPVPGALPLFAAGLAVLGAGVYRRRTLKA